MFKFKKLEPQANLSLGYVHNRLWLALTVNVYETIIVKIYRDLWMIWGLLNNQ